MIRPSTEARMAGWAYQESQERTVVPLIFLVLILFNFQWQNFIQSFFHHRSKHYEPTSVHPSSLIAFQLSA
jgi:hypothetical protein